MKHRIIKIIKLVSRIFFVFFYITVSAIKFCTIKVLLCDAPITEIYFATNLCQENSFKPHKGFVMYNCDEDYQTLNPKAKMILRKDEFDDSLYDFIVGGAWFILPSFLVLYMILRIARKIQRKHCATNSCNQVSLPNKDIL